MAEISEIFQEFNYFTLVYKFGVTEKEDQISDALKKLSLLKFENIKMDYHIERLNIFEELIPEMGYLPNLSLELGPIELLLSNAKINISYPKEGSKRGRTIRTTKERIRIFPAFVPREDEKPKFSIQDLDRVDLLLKSFLISDILNKKIPQIDEISIYFGINLEKEAKMQFINNLIEENLLKNVKLNIEDIGLEIEEDKNKYYFGISSDNEHIRCNFIFQGTEFSIIENKIEDILQRCYNVFNKYLKDLKI